MQTIVKDGVSLYLFADNATLSISDENIVTPDFVVSDCNSANSVVYQGVTAPDDWVGGKYCLDGSSWAVNPLWVDPKAEQEAKRKAAYTAEADPLFFQWQAGEGTEADWLAKRQEIRDRYPYPAE
jgi:hypothetical protein